MKRIYRNARRIATLSLLSVLVLSLSACPGQRYDPDEAPRFEEEVLALTNAERQARGGLPMERDPAVDQVALQHSEDMMIQRYVAHTNPDGDGPGERLNAAEIPWVIAGENVARVRGSLRSNPAEVVVDGWMRSPGHRANILDSDWTHTGVGIAIEDRLVYITQLFINYGDEEEGAKALAQADFVYISGALELE